MQLIFWNSEGRNIHSEGSSFNVACADRARLISKPFTRLWTSKTVTVTYYTNSKAAAQSDQESSLDVEFF